MKFIHKVVGVHVFLISSAFSFSLGNDTPRLAPIAIGDGLVIFVPVPIVTLKGSSTVNLIVGKPYIEAGISPRDDISVDTLTKTGSVNIYRPGTYIIRYTILTTDGQRVNLTRRVLVNSLDTLLPHDTNTYFAPYGERDYLYFADPQPDENGLNRIVRVNYAAMSYDESVDSVILTEDAYLIDGKTHSNPHSVDRAGKTNKFYVRTQNAYSFDVVAVENGKLVYKKTVPLSININGLEVPYSPRAFGAYNAKYDIQLLSARNSDGYNIVSIIDVKTDTVLKTLYKSIGANSSTVTGHAKWLDENHFAMVDRGNHSIDVYKVFKYTEGNIDARYTSSLDTISPLHGIERIKSPKNAEDLNTFYILGAASGTNGSVTHPFVKKLIFDPSNGSFLTIQDNPTFNITAFSDTDYTGLNTQNIPATTHHSNMTPDGKYIVAPVYDGKIYKIDANTMQVVASINTGIEKGLGAAHIEFSKSLGIAVITNHWSPYITIIDISNNQFKLKGYVKIYKDGHHDVYHKDAPHLMQPHFAQMGKYGKYVYTFASQDDGRFVRVNLEEVLNLSLDTDKVFQFDNNSDDTAVMKAIYTGGAPEQAHS